jgi:hypothetical protein
MASLVLHSPVMANQKLSSDIRRYALAGAQARLAEISLELEAIRRAFPELGANGSSGARTRQSQVNSGGEPTPSPTRRRRTMSAAQRKAVGDRMKKYWAARRAGTSASTTEAGADSNGTAGAKNTRAARGAKAASAKRGPNTMSPEARKRISDAQKARWAAQRSGAKATSASESSETPSAAPRKRRGAVRARTRAVKRGSRTMSAAARKRISQVQKKRWATTRKAA